MKHFSVAVREAWIEIQFGLKSGVVALTFIGLVSYLLMVLTNADYLQQMGSVDVPRNAPNLIYLMSAGDVFFLFFAWAWVFAQPVVRDRQASLHEFVLTTPVSLRALLLGRYVGALIIGLLLGLSQTVGFLISPILEVFGLVPAGSIAPTAWAAIAWSSLIFILLPTAGIGALYYTLALKFRSSAGPFAASAGLISLWMFSMIVLSEGGILIDFAAVVDPSSFGEVERLNKNWTPVEKATILYPLTTPFILNRLLWCVLPVLLMLWVIRGISREQLIQDRSPAKMHSTVAEAVATAATSTHKYVTTSVPAHYNWLRTAFAEIRWQHAMLFSGKTFYLLALGLLIMTAAAGFVHGVNHIDGPFEARPEFTLPIHNQVMYLIIAFVAAALVGRVLRRDHHAGIVEVLDASPVPPWVCFIAKLAAVGTLTFLLLLIPGVAAMILALADEPQSFSFWTPIIYQVAIYGPGLAEIVTITVFVHCLIRRVGAAYAASMLATFIMVVNHETGLVSYPPLEFGIPAHIDYSILTGWGEWGERLLVGDAYKLAVVLLLIALSLIVQIRGFDSRLRCGAKVLRERLVGPMGVVTAASLLTCVFLYSLMDQRFVEQGGYQTRDGELQERASWEAAWLPLAGEWTVAGGELRVVVNTTEGQVNGQWQLDQLRSNNGLLHLELPKGLELLRVLVEDTLATVQQSEGHAAVELGSCAVSGCNVVLEYEVAPRGWSTEGEQRWLGPTGIWADARQLAPRLGLDYNKRIVAKADRIRFGLAQDSVPVPRQALQAATGIAPKGKWQLDIVVDGEARVQQLNQALDFVVFNASRARSHQAGPITVYSDRTRVAKARLVAEDAVEMQACVSRRLGSEPALQVIAQLPRGMGETRIASETLLLAEEPHWDAGDSGTARWRRQSELAASLATDVLSRRLDLRQNEGAQAFLSGVSGAVAYLCAGDLNGVDAFATLLNRASERISKALATAESPIMAASFDTTDAWLDEYVAAAYIPWVANASAVEFQALLTTINQSGSIKSGLASLGGARFAEEVLGVPSSVELSVAGSGNGQVSMERFVWAAGGWRKMDEAKAVKTKPVIGLRPDTAGFLSAYPVRGEAGSTGDGGVIMLANVPAFERTPSDNQLATLGSDVKN